MSIRFGTDGWRAIMGWDFTADKVRACAQGVAQYLSKTRLASRGLVVGYDTRFASESFAMEVAQVSAGNAIKTFFSNKAVPTPVVSYSIIDRHAGGGVIITASHNPPQWNGFKYKPEYGGSASVEVVEALETEIDLATDNQILEIPFEVGNEKGLIEEVDLATPYLAHIAELVDLDAIRQSGLRVAVDVMYGAGSGYIPRLIGNNSSNINEIHSERNPSFPGMAQPEPVASNLTALSEYVVSNNIDVGLALDGDADRAGIMDERGRFISTLETYALLCLYLLEVRELRGPLVKSITMTNMVYKLGQLFGVPVYETPVGFKYLGPVMQAKNALAAGEESGGYAFRGHIPERDGILSDLFFLDLVVKTGKRPSELVEYLFSKVGEHYFDRHDISLDPNQRSNIIQKVTASNPVTLAGKRILKRDDLDGTRFQLEGGSWTLIRFSGTEPLLRIYAEGQSPQQVEQLLEDARSLAGV